jgi:Holliday junction resolvasome RuvABC ATP-dependent DNA helicase subunit
MAQRALDMLNVDKDGLDTLDRRYFSMLLERFDGGPAGVEALQPLWLKIAEHLKMLLNLI